MKKHLITVILLAGLTGACTGGLSKVDAEGVLPDGQTPTTPVKPDEPVVKPDAPKETLDQMCRTVVDVDRAPMRRLSRTEYQNSINTLFGIDYDATSKLSADEKIAAFDANVVASVDELMAEEYLNAAEAIAIEAVKDPQKLMGCGFDQADNGCIDTFIEGFGKRIYRRPLTTTEQENLKATYVELRNQYDAKTGVQAVLMSMLQSPHFLYRLELGAQAGPNEQLVKLNAYEVATRLSFFLLQSTPDQTLIEAAEAGQLDTPEQIEVQARRLLQQDTAREVVRNFHRQWLGLEEVQNIVKAKEVFPKFDEAMLYAMQRETESFIDHVMWEQNGSLEVLLSAPYTFVDKNIASIYGVSAPDGDGFEFTMLDDTRRAGILTHPSMLARMSHTEYTSPTLRGEWVRKYLLCETLIPPPDDFDTTPPMFDPNKNTRQRYEVILNNPTCGGCHAKTDPIGFGFEHYDAMGQWRQNDDGHTIDDSGEVLYTPGLEGKFKGTVELAKKLARSEQVQACVTKQWFRFALGRYESEFDTCSMHEAKKKFAQSNYDIRELLVALTISDAFRYRRADKGE